MQNLLTKEYRIFGLGRWHDNDTLVLPHFLHAGCHTGDATIAAASFSLTPQKCQRPVDAKLFNLEPAGSKHGTVRCIRAYESVTFKQLHRIDWEPAPALNENTTLYSDKYKKEVEKFLDLKPKNLAVIIDDHLKGVIDDNLVKCIQDKLKDQNETARWFVRTKDKRIRETANKANREDNMEWPAWLRNLDRIELLAVGPEISSRSYPNNRLLTDNDRLVEHAYELIDALRSKERRNKRQVTHLVLTSDSLEVVVVLGEWCFSAKPSDKIKNIDLEKINWTSAFFAALAHEVLTAKEEWESDEEACQKMVERAANNAHEHSGVRLPKSLGTTSTGSGKAKITTNVRRLDTWAVTHRDWVSAKLVDHFGIIDDQDKEAKTKQALVIVPATPGSAGLPPASGPETRAPKSSVLAGTTTKATKHLDVWRASTDLPGYIVCIKEKRAAIRRIWQKINSFVQQDDALQSVSILLEADPGVGKSYLAEKLSDNIPNCTLVKCDITQMVERTELLDLFDMVASAQAEKSGPVFVFVDEINATLGGSPVYGAFLSPLEAGTYTRNGQHTKLKPCIWMFAGTRDNKGENENRVQTEKRADFEKRMTLYTKIDYRSLNENRIGERNKVDVINEAKLEQVYLGAQMINNAFKDVNQIDEEVLKAFAMLEPSEAPARSIKRMANSLENVQYGRVHKGNCTSLEWVDFIAGTLGAERQGSQYQATWREEFRLGDVSYVQLNLK